MAQTYLKTIGRLVKQPLTAITPDEARSKFKVISSALLFLHLLFAVMALVNTANAQTYTPRNYWTFNSSPVNKDSMGNFNIDFTSYACGYSVNNGGVSKCLTLGSTGDNINAGNFVPDTAFTIELLFKPGYQFNSTTLFRRLDGALQVSMNLQGLTFSTYTNGTGSNDLAVKFEGIGRASYGYYVDGNWHHLVFKYSSNTGKKEIYVDGECPTGFSNTISGKLVNGANTSLFFNQGVTYYKYYGEYDEIAVYMSSIPQALIYKHYTEAVQQGKTYGFVNNYSGSIPATSSVSGPLDYTEFAPGHPSVNTTALDQLQSYPTPRYKPGNTLMKNFNWIDMMYMGGRFQPGVSDAQSVTNSVSLNEELARNWNYMLQLRLSTDAWGTAWINSANANPQWGTSIITLRAQLYPSNIISQSMASSNYLQNSSGSYLDPQGNSGSSHKWWRPTVSPTVYENDGTQQRSNLQTITNMMTRPLTMINENGEVFPWHNDNALAQDPAVVSAKNASGLDYQTFQGRKFKENETQSYRDKFMSLPALANTKFTEYGIDGFPQYRQKYSEARLVNSQINNQYYSTPDFYPRWPNNWRNWVSAWHGWQWIVDSRYYELQAGDNLFSPFLAAGWDVNEENNMRPAQFLGLVKCLNMIGAEFFYAGYFNEQGNYGGSNPPPGNPANYAWQAAIPSYAQALASRYELLLRHGQVMNGDVPAYTSNPGKPGYAFWAGDQRKIVVARKHNTLAQYAITGTIQPSTSMVGGAENTSLATITLDGQQLKFYVRRQGSTYIYDNTDAANPVFYQIDEWHEKTHPSYWSKDFTIEAELYDNTNATYSLKTVRAAGTQAGNYVGATTAVTFPSGQSTFTAMEYNFQPRTSAQASQYLWVRARSKDGSSTGVSMSVDNGTAKTISCITDTAWAWYRYDACNQQPIQFTGLSLANHVIRFTPTNAKLEFDKFMLVSSASTLLSNAAPNCSSGSTATITANGPTSICTGGSVSLTASAGSSYLWSNGATTQTISVTQAGNYAVTVGQGGGCSAVSSPVAITVGSAPSAVITASGSTSICQGGSVTLTASSANSYLWSNGATTQSITVSAAGNYTVQVTNASGCSATSSATNVSVTTGSAATVTPSGALAFCQGGSVTLSANSASNYLWSNGATTQSISVSANGTYSVTINNGSGCASVSTPVTVSVYALPTATIAVSGSTTFCQGGSVVLTASAGSSYLWSNGSTSQSITATTSGNYVVTVTNSNGCSKTSVATTVTVDPIPSATISANGPTTFCQGGNVRLTASAGSSYLWTPGNLTTQSITVTNTGSYSVVVSSASGCSAQSAATAVTVNTSPVATITANGSTSFCQGGSVVLTANSGSAYLWSNGAITQSINVTTAGTYLVTVTTGNCTATSAPVTTSITTSATATITASGATTFCQGGSVTLSANSGNAYLWSNGATTQSINVNSSGTYTVTVTTGTCTATSAPKTVTVNQLPVAAITASGATTFCQGGSVTLTANAGSSYLWSNGATTQSINATASGSYTVSVSNGICSAVSQPMAVTANALPVATISTSGTTNLAQGQSVTLTASAGNSYLWLPGGQTTQSISVNTGGSYTVKITNAQGCSATSAATIVTVSQPTQATISTSTGSNAICSGQSITLTASTGTNYMWIPNLVNTQSVTVNTPGTYSVTVLNANGTTSTATITIVTAAKPSIPSVTYTYIQSAAYQLTAYEGSAASYIWSSGATVPTITVNAAGTYHVKAVNSNGCQSDPRYVKVNSILPVHCDKPNMLTSYNVIDREASVMWNPAITADSFLVSYTQRGSTISGRVYVRNTNSVRIKELTAGKTYDWNVTAICPNGQFNSDPTYFTTLQGPTGCGYAVQNSFTTNITNSSAQLNWFGTVASQVTVRYKKVGATSYNYQTISVGSTAAWGYALSGLASSTTYQWSAKTGCGTNNSPYPSDVSFTTLGNCPAMNTPSASDVVATSAKIKWDASVQASYIQVRYAKYGTADYKYVTVWGNPGSKTISGLTSGTKYNAWVRLACTTTTMSAWSAPVTFTTTVVRLSDSEVDNLQLNAYPNPAYDKITYVFTTEKAGSYSVKVADMTGRELIQEIKEANEGENSGQLDLTNYSNGFYLIIIKKGGNESHFRFHVHK